MLVTSNPSRDKGMISHTVLCWLSGPSRDKGMITYTVLCWLCMKLTAIDQKEIDPLIGSRIKVYEAIAGRIYLERRKHKRIRKIYIAFCSLFLSKFLHGSKVRVQNYDLNCVHQI